MKLGKNVTIYGNVPAHLEAGDNCTVIGPTDTRGNTILNRPMAIGCGAKAGPDSIAVGAWAGAGLNTQSAITAKAMVYKAMEVGSKILDRI